MPIDPDDPDDPGDGDGDGDTGGGGGETLPYEVGIYYYHGDHLGSSSIITDRKGRDYEHIEYFPYGETWVDEHRNRTNLPYKFTGKELDPETGLYYYGARYYDPVLSQWISADPILGKYLPTGDREQDRNLPGMGGVFNPLNLGLFTYTNLNPEKFNDPDGKEILDEKAVGIINDNLVKARNIVADLNMRYRGDRAVLATIATAAGYYKNLDEAARVVRMRNDDAKLYQRYIYDVLTDAAANKYLPQIAGEITDKAVGPNGAYSGGAAINIISALSKPSSIIGKSSTILGAALDMKDLYDVAKLTEKVHGIAPEAVDNLIRRGISYYADKCDKSLNCGKP